MTFEWEAAKEEQNRRKHKVAFTEAQTAFASAAIFEDSSHSDEEDRYIAIGLSEKSRLLTIAFTFRGEDTIRLISARRSTAREAREYGQAKQQEKQGGNAAAGRAGP